MKLPGYHPNLERQLSALVDSNRVPHAIVMDGGSREARVNLADEIAKAVLCTGRGEAPCGQCLACKKAEGHIHPDVSYIRPEEKKKTVSVEVIRNMRQDAFIVPNEGNGKIYIIEQAELLPVYAQNALLKILEEPPSYAYFILCCESKAVLLDTVLSRVAVFSLNTDHRGDMEASTAEEVKAQASKLAKALASKSELNLLRETAYFEKHYDILPAVAEQLGLIVRDAMVYHETKGISALSGQPQESELLAKTFDSAALGRLADALHDLVKATAMYANKNLTITRFGSLFMTAIGGTA